MGETIQVLLDMLGSGGIGIATIVMYAYWRKDKQLEARNDQILKLHETRIAADTARDATLDRIRELLTAMAGK